MDKGDWNGLFGPDEYETVPEQVEEIVDEPVVQVSNDREVDAENRKEKYKLYHSVKFTVEEEKKFQQIVIALGAVTDSKAIKWLLEEVYLNNEDKIKRIVEKKRNMETL